jgi:hypothetical protein
LIAGVDDTSLSKVQIIPRVPPSWSGYHLANWPILTRNGVVRADISFERKDGAVHFSLKVKGNSIPKLAVCLPDGNKTIWKYEDNVDNFTYASPVPKANETASGKSESVAE